MKHLSAYERWTATLYRFVVRTPKPPLLVRYGVAVLSSAAALIITRATNVTIEPHAPQLVGLFLCAILLSAWSGGLGPGLLASVLAALAFEYSFVSPIASLTVEITELLRLLLFALPALLVAAWGATQHRHAVALRRMRSALDETVQSLQAENAERQRAEALLHAREQEFRAIVENAPDHIIRYSRDFRRTYANPAVAEAYGLPMEAVIGQPVGSVLQDAGMATKPDEVAQVRRHIAEVFANGRSEEYEMYWPVPTGRRCYSVQMFPERDCTGAVVNVLSIARDITERKHAENELRRQKEILQTIFDHIPLTIAFVSENGRLELVNRAWEHSLGWTLHELAEHQLDIYALAFPDPHDRQQAQEFIAAATGEWADFTARVRDGREIAVTVASVRLSDRTSLVIAQDITTRQQVEAERAQLYAQVQASNEQLQTLSRQLLRVQETERHAIARELHDEIGQRLSGIGLMLTLCQQLPPDLAQVQLNKAQTFVEEVIGQVRTLALDLRPAILDDFGLVSALQWLFGRYTTQMNVTVEFESGLSEEQRFDPDLEMAVYRIIQEALTNVARHAGAREAVVRLWIDGEALVVIIADRGCGFNSQTIDTHRSSGLTGMQERAALLGGNLTIESAAGAGTRVSARVPRGAGNDREEKRTTDRYA
jgi:PAS domain S-box-containing protein